MTGPFRVPVDPELALAYALATNDDNPRYAAGECAPPLFGVAAAAPAVNGVYHQMFTEYPYIDLIHVGEDCLFHRGIAPGDTLVVVAAMLSIRPSPLGALLTHKTTITDEHGRPVQDNYGTVLVPSLREVAASGEAAPDPTVIGLRRSRPRHERSVELTDDQAFRYCAGSGDWQPIHYSDDAARAAGLPGVVLHGMCTMALCAAGVTDLVAEGDPNRLARLAVRFSNPVLPGTQLTVRISEPIQLDGMQCHAVRADSDGRPAVRGGRADVRP